MSEFAFFTCWLKRELLVYMRKPSQVINPLLFFLLITSLFPLGLSIEQSMLQKIAPGLIWIAVLLSSLLLMDRIFYHDFESGILEQILLRRKFVLQVIYAKFLILWLVSVTPMILITPIIIIMYNLNLITGIALICSLLVGTPIISMLIVIIASLVIAAGDRNALVSLIFLPLAIPVLVFGAGSTLLTMQGGDGWSVLLLLLGVGLIGLVIGPLVAKRALYLSLE